MDDDKKKEIRGEDLISFANQQGPEKTLSLLCGREGDKHCPIRAKLQNGKIATVIDLVFKSHVSNEEKENEASRIHQSFSAAQSIQVDVGLEHLYKVDEVQGRRLANKKHFGRRLNPEMEDVAGLRIMMGTDSQQAELLVSGVDTTMYDAPALIGALLGIVFVFSFSPKKMKCCTFKPPSTGTAALELF
jgi:hypothetical protein